MVLLRPDWPAPPWVRACATTRLGGVSVGAHRGLNLADHVGDDPQRVAQNRARLRAALDLPDEPRWLNQVHGCRVAPAATATPGAPADASVTGIPGVVCVVLTADCLPLLICDRQGRAVAAVHAGWRGLVAGVIERGLDAVRATAANRTGAATGAAPSELLVWLGPAIGPAAFEVGPEVRAALVAADPGAAAAVRPGVGDRWLADLGALARSRLTRAGVAGVYGGGVCTYGDPGRFYSYRRDGVTGRMASLIWLAGPDGAPRPGDDPGANGATDRGHRSASQGP